MPQASVASLANASGVRSIAGPVRGVESASFDLQRGALALFAIVVEIALLAIACAAIYALATMVLSRAAKLHRDHARTWAARVKARTRQALTLAFVTLAAALLAYNGWLLARGLDVWTYTEALIGSVNPETWLAIIVALGKLALAVVGLIVGARFLRRGLRSAERALNRWDQTKKNNQSLAALIKGLDDVIVNTAWLLLGAIASEWLGVPQSITTTLLVIIRIYLVIAVGIMVIRCAALIVDTLDGWAHHSAHGRGWVRYYEHLHPLLPTFHACLEYALWIGMAALVLAQVSAFRELAIWGPRFIEAIGIFFLGRVVIELGNLEIGHRMLPREGLDEMDRRRRETMVPLVRSAFTYGAYFGTAVLILGSLGFNPMPFLAGAGILGLVVGFGAQSLINDVVSGFFILFENTYLVGDTVEVANAKGVVEAIEFRTTKIRDIDGRLHVVRNGDTKPLINYSKDYTLAVVGMEVTYDANLRDVFSALRQAGERLREDNPDVLADAEIEGVTAFGATTMTIRTSVRVKPGRHDAVAAQLRLLIKEAFDRQARGLSRKGLILRLDESREPWPETEKAP
jgi:moderate conductance mechanosensitive channel